MNQSLRFIAMALCALGFVLLIVAQVVPFAAVREPTAAGLDTYSYRAWGQSNGDDFVTWFNTAKGDGLQMIQGGAFALVLGTLMVGAAAIVMLMGRVGVGGALGILGGMAVVAFILLMAFGLDSWKTDQGLTAGVDYGPGFFLGLVGLVAGAGGGIIGVMPSTLAENDPTRPTGPVLSVETPKAFNPLASMDDPKQFRADPPKDYKSFDIRVGSKEFATPPKPGEEAEWTQKQDAAAGFEAVPDEGPVVAAPAAPTGPGAGKIAPPQGAAAPAPGATRPVQQATGAPGAKPAAPAPGATKPVQQAAAAPSATKPVQATAPVAKPAAPGAPNAATKPATPPAKK